MLGAFFSRWSAVLAVAMLLGGCASWDSPEALARTYTEARVAIPRVVRQGIEITPGYSGVMSSDAAQRSLRAIAASGVRMPVVIYLHGCSGIGFHELVDLSQIATVGAIAVAPNSYARAGRPTACDPATYLHLGPGMWQIRVNELQYARDRIAAEPWVDDRRVAIFGFSEGGFVVAGTRDARYVGYVVTGCNCNGNGQVGIYAPADKPVLAIRSAADPWLQTPDACDRAVAGRPNSRSLRIEKVGHYMNSEPEAHAAIESFLRVTMGLR
jgi:dienelactone hydrolase